MNKLDATLALSKLLSTTYNDFEELKRVVESDTSSWEVIISVANKHVLIPALYGALMQKDLLRFVKDEQLFAYIQEVYKLNTKRNEAILKQLKRISELLSYINVKPVFLKGAAALTQKHYKNIGERVMLDIDILVPESKIFAVIELLKFEGEYKEMQEDIPLENKWHHYRRLYKSDEAAAVEIHRYATSEKSFKYFPKELNKNYFLACDTVENVYILKPEYELYHSFLHTQIAHEYHKDKFLDLRHLHHFSILFERKKLDKEFLSQLVDKNSLTQEWNEFLSLLQEISLIKEDERLKRNTEKAYIQKVFERINIEETKAFKIKDFISKKVSLWFGYESLKGQYGFNSKGLLPVFMFVNLFKLLKNSIKNGNKRHKLLHEIKYAFS